MEPTPQRITSSGQQILLEESVSVRLVLTGLVRAYANTIAEHGCRMASDREVRENCDRLAADIGAAAEAYARVLDMMEWPFEQACKAISDAMTEGGALGAGLEIAMRERAVQSARNIYGSIGDRRAAT